MGIEDLVTQIRVDTTLLPPIILNQPFSASATVSNPSPLLQFLKPQVSVQVGSGSPVTVAPYGSPGASKWPMVQAGIAIALMLALAYMHRKK